MVVELKLQYEIGFFEVTVLLMSNKTKTHFHLSWQVLQETDRWQCVYLLANDLPRQTQTTFKHSTDRVVIHRIVIERMMMAQRDTATVDYPFKWSSAVELQYMTIFYLFLFVCVSTLAMEGKSSRYIYYFFPKLIQYILLSVLVSQNQPSSFPLVWIPYNWYSSPFV